MNRTLAQVDQQPEFFSSGPSGYLRVNQGQAEQATATQDDVARMVYHLKRHGWQTAASIAAALDLGYGDAGKRKARAIANQSHGQIISGQGGYAATVTASDDERRHACAWLRSQAREMDQRALEIEAYSNREG